MRTAGLAVIFTICVMLALVKQVHVNGMPFHIAAIGGDR